ncbi:MAG: FtsX-like permease family protein [Paracoccaceae bacterium]|nr:FtsX-like permease family protein [Paracoccaceae bacterium]
MGASLGALVSHWRRQPGQFATLILGLALATALWTGVQAINAEARSSYAAAANALGGSAEEFVRPGGAFTTEDFVTLRRAGWRVSPVLEGWLPAERGRVRLIGLDPLTAPPGTGAADVAIETPLEFLTGAGQILAAPPTAARLGSGQGAPVVAVDGLAPGLAFADIGIAGRLLGRSGEIDRMVLHPEQVTGLAKPSGLVSGLERQRPATAEDLARLTDSFHLNLTAFGFLSFAVALFIVHGAIGLAFEQRRVVFRTLRTLGLPVRLLVILLLLELLAIAVVAGGLGVGLGYLIAAALLPDVAATLRGLYGATVEGTLTIAPLWWGLGFAIAILGTGVAAAGALWKVARLPLLAPARPRAWARGSATTMRAQLASSAVLGAAALVAGLTGGGLVAGFVLLGALLLAAALALPAILAGVLSLGARFARRPLAEWFWADTRQQLPGLSLALMALLLALSANIGVGTMVSSFRLTFLGWLDQRLAAELYVSAEDARQAAALLDHLDGRVTALPIWGVDADIEGAPGEVYSVADHTTYRETWPLLSALPGGWDRVAAGEAAMINEQLARREGLVPGDEVALPGGALTIAGVYSDYGNPLAQALVSPATFVVRFPDADRTDFGLRVAPEDADALRRALTEEVGIDPGRIVDQEALKAVSRQVFERTFAVTGALNVLTLAVAGFAILTSLLTLANMRLPGLAPVWALGLTRARLAGVELLRAVLLAALTALAALPVGLLLAWVLLAVINVEAFGWRLPMHLFPGQWAALFALSLLAAALAALWPARRLARRPAADLIKVFAHER